MYNLYLYRHKIGHNLPNFINERAKNLNLNQFQKISSPSRTIESIALDLASRLRKNRNKSIEIRREIRRSSIHATFSDIFHKIQMTGKGGREEGRKVDGYYRTVIRIADTTRLQILCTLVVASIRLLV